MRRRSNDMKIGICGVGGFGSHFAELFKVHPDVSELVLADVRPERLEHLAQKLGVKRTFPSLDALCESDVDAVALFTQRWMHAPQAVQALKAGKHVYSAVPAAVTLAELAELVDTVRSTGLIYMLGETSYYRPQTIYCRERFAQGDFGKFVYGEGQYHHDMSKFYASFSRSGGDAWKETASFPPMLYPTHSISHVLSVTFRRMTKVSCFGFMDDHEDGIFRSELSRWGNRFSNQTALFRTSDGGMARINEFRRTGARNSRMSIFGTLGAYEEQPGAKGRFSAVWTGSRQVEENPKGGVFDYENAARFIKRTKEDEAHILACSGVEITEENLGTLPPNYIGRTHVGVSGVHPVQRLPKEFVGQPTGHSGSHQFLVVDFVEACRTGKLPPNNVWMAARYNAPGIVAHESALREGELLEIPDFGVPPTEKELLDPRAALKD